MGDIRISRKLSIPINVVRHWLYHNRNPIRQGNPHLFNPQPTPELAYVIGVVQGDGDLHLHFPATRRSGRVIRLRAKDKEFVEKFALATTKLLGKNEPYKVGFERGQYSACAYSYYLYEFLKKPLEELKPFIEAFPLEFVKGVMDSEGCVQVNTWRWKNWETLIVKITMTNTNLKLLLYIQELLSRCLNIRSRIKRSYKKGSKFERNGKIFVRNKDAFDLVIGTINDVKLFASRIGFSILRKQQKLFDAIRIIESCNKGKERTKEWLKLYKKEKGKWIKI